MDKMPRNQIECLKMGLHNTEIDEDRSCAFCWNQPASPTLYCERCGAETEEMPCSTCRDELERGGKFRAFAARIGAPPITLLATNKRPSVELCVEMSIHNTKKNQDGSCKSCGKKDS